MKKIRKLILITLIALAISSVFMVNASADGLAYGVATVSVPVLNLREGPGTDYSVNTRIREDDAVVILDRSDDEWYRVNFQGEIGYVNAQFLNDVLATGYLDAQGRIVGSVVNVRSAPDTTSSVVGRRNVGAIVNIVGISDGWFRVRIGGQTGYVRSDLVELTYIGVAAAGEKAQQIVDFAMEYLGWRYVFGGNSPATGFDCSGFVSYVFRNFGITLTRNSAGQYRNDGVPVTRDELMPGDLVFFGSGGRVSHVGLYIGDGYMIHASTTTTGVIITSINSPQRISRWIGARRVI